MLLNLLGNPFVNTRTILDNFKGFLLSSDILNAMQAVIHNAAPAASRGYVSFGFGWWYDAHTEGAPALA
jgi:hypothetical protein